MKKTQNRINSQIVGVSQVRLVGDNVEQGIYSFNEAYKIADDLNLDLVEISPNANPPVCKVIDYQKFLYQQKKKEKERESNSQKTEVKEIRFTPNTGDNDYQFKLKHAIEFLKEGNKVKASIFFKGRELTYTERGEIMLLNLCNDLSEYGVPDKVPELEGKRLQVIITPKKK